MSAKKPTYFELLKHPKWQKKRLDILKSANFECQNCGDDDVTLHVHHGAYIKGRKPWEYHTNQFHVLCENCHNEASYFQERITEAFSVISPSDYHYVMMILEAYGMGRSVKEVNSAIFGVCGLLGIDQAFLIPVAQLASFYAKHKHLDAKPVDTNAEEEVVF